MKKKTTMPNKFEIEDWWRHNGCYDRQQASGIHYDGNAQEYLKKTDDWWFSLSLAERKFVYCNFFVEE